MSYCKFSVRSVPRLYDEDQQSSDIVVFMLLDALSDERTGL
jgi:hypothetical protein